jgi:hypothetical protein
LNRILYTLTALHGMLCVRAPRVKYESVDELVRLCVVVAEEYTKQVDALVQEIWNEKHVKKRWSGYDRLMLGIFCFQEFIVSTIAKILQSTKNRGAIYACTVHREICLHLNEANRQYIHSTVAPDVQDLLHVLRETSANLVLMGDNSLLMRQLRENFCRCLDADGHAWLVCPRQKLVEYILSVCMSHHERLGAHAALSALPADIIRDIMQFLFARTSWDSHP